MEDVALFLHLIGVLVFVAGIVLAGVVFESARRCEQLAQIALLLSLVRSAVVLVGFGGLLLFMCGLWLVELEGIGYGTGWVDAAIVLFVVALVLGGLGGQRPKEARKLATQLAGEGKPASPELRALLDDPLSRTVNYASGSLIVMILALMIFKP
ncbi:MAG TPA: DUF2269 family protein [Solirubrobacterales bacterium]|nr:DUF2269 family protein [Solirubrobacterales bacterium]